MVNYVELINHYAQPLGNGGFERYQCFRVISLLLRTPISAPLPAIPFISQSESLTGSEVTSLHLKYPF